ncbi:MAG: hypothetical protein QOJ26_1350 [Thermoplasmata archaeon]|jgi:hypothetical protein|nr:hypothetical protein [Thermoplasmata archaeon]MEA3166478.1 hypothetical protein [Thermoplasmata archaeon]
MRILTLAFAAAIALSFLTITAEPAKAVGLCADESGHNGNPDLYNNMGPQPQADCDGIFCYGYSGNGNWNTCIPPPIYCSQYAPCPPPQTTQSSSGAPALCTYGDTYNNQAGQPSSDCDGALCTGFSQGQWNTCVLDCTTDGCPRIEDPCRNLMCQPPMDP